MFRDLNRVDDFEGIRRVWMDSGWLDDTASNTEGLRAFLEGTVGTVHEEAGVIDMVATSRDALYRYEDQELPVNMVSSINVSRDARGLGYGGAGAARVVASGAERGAALAMLGMFEQGFYDRLGFGSGPRHASFTVDPAALRVPRLTRRPVRLTIEDAERIHASRVARRRTHGAPNFPGDVGATRSEILWSENGFGMGFVDDRGVLTHHLWSTAKGEHGPYHIAWLAYQSAEQLLELLGIIASWRDQVHGVRLMELPGVQLEDLVKSPHAHLRQVKGEFAANPRSIPWWQARICDLPACISAVSLQGEPVRFDLTLRDPIATYLPAETPWRGVSPNWTVTLGRQSSAENGHDGSLPVMTASVGAFTRLWLGVQPASGLAYTDELIAPPALLKTLDRRFRPPTPVVDWDV